MILTVQCSNVKAKPIKTEKVLKTIIKPNMGVLFIYFYF